MSNDIPAYGLGNRQPQMPPPESENDKDDNDYFDDIFEGKGIEEAHTIDLSAETLQLFLLTKRLLRRALQDKRAPVNQQAQTVNSLRAVLDGLVKTQTDLYNADRLKKMEATVIECLRETSIDLQDKFLKLYSERTENV